MSPLPECTHMYHMHPQCLLSSEEAVRAPKTEVTDGYEIPGGCWAMNQGPL